MLDSYVRNNANATEGDFFGRYASGQGEFFITKEGFVRFLEYEEKQEAAAAEGVPGGELLKRYRHVFGSIAEIVRKTYAFSD